MTPKIGIPLGVAIIILGTILANHAEGALSLAIYVVAYAGGGGVIAYSRKPRLSQQEIDEFTS